MDLSSFVRRDISGIRKDILPLSGFGILSHALADEIAARNQTREGYFYTTDMEFLEEAEPEQPPVIPPRPRQPETIRMDMTLLFKIVQENQESGKALPAGTQKLLERVRTILRTSPQSRAISAPQAVRRVYVPLPQSAPSPQSTRLTPTALRQSAPQYLPQNRMQNPLRDPKAPLAVEKMQMPSREVPRASDHAMLFSDVLHRAQDSGLTFATRKGQGGLPASAQTRTAYTTQALRQAKAEQQAAEEQSIPVWQKMMQKEASQTSTDVSGASWRFDETGSAQQKTNETSIDNALRAEKLVPTLPAQKMPENAAGILQQMAAPRYPEAELNFAQEEAPTEGSEVPVSAAKNPSAESIRAVQEASAKALTESVRSALKEAVPLMTATAQETVQKQERQAAPNIPLQSTAVVENRAGKAANAAKSDTVVASEKAQAQRTETKHTVASRNAENSSDEDAATGTAESAGHGQMQGGATENHARQKNAEKALSAELKEATTIRMDEAEESSEVVRKPTAGFAECKSAPQKTAEVSTQKAVEHSQLGPEEQAEMSGNAETLQMPEQTAKQSQEIKQAQTVEATRGQPQFVNAEEKKETTAATMRGQPQNAKEEATSETVTHPEGSVLSRSQDAEHKVGAEYETGVEQTLDAEHEADAERIPALNGDRAFAETPKNAVSVFRQMAAPRYPEAELNFAQEEAPTEGAEVPVPTAQHPSAESIRAMQEASAKALTESVRSALKEAAPLMTATVQETVQKQAEQVVQTVRTGQQKAARSISPANANAQTADAAQNRTTPQMREATQPTARRENVQQARENASNIPQQSTAAVENRAGKTTNAAKSDTVIASEKAQEQRTETKHTVASNNAENSSAENAAADTAKSAEHGQMQGGATENPARQKSTEKTLSAEPKEASAIRMNEAEESAEVVRKPTADFAERKSAPQRMAEVSTQKAVEHSQLGPEEQAEMSENAGTFRIPGQTAKQSQETMREQTTKVTQGQPQFVNAEEKTEATVRGQSQNAKEEATSETATHPESSVLSKSQDAERKVGAEYETGIEQTLDTEYEADAERIPALNGDRAFAETPENAVSVFRQMAAPRYPEAEMNFAQEEALMEGAEMPVPMAPGAESIRAMQEASAKALNESVRAALKEAAPLMTATVQETVQKQAEQVVQSVARREMAHGTPQNASPANVTARAASPAQNIPPQNNTAVENRAEKTANAVNPSAMTAPGKVQGRYEENKGTVVSRNAENIPVEKALSAELKKTSAILTRETTGKSEAMQKQNANFAEHKTVLQKATETPAQETVEQSRKNPEEQTQISGNAELHRMTEQTSKITREQMPDEDKSAEVMATTAENSESTISTQPQDTERKTDVEHETGAEQAADAKHEGSAERIPALNGDRAFAEAPENAVSILQQMAAPRYPEAELNFAQEEKPTEGAEMPVSMAQHPSAESIRVMQEASAKALTESVRSALKEAAPLMTATAQETLQKQAEQAVQSAVTAVLEEKTVQPGTSAQDRLTQKVTEAVNRSIDTALKQSAPQLQQAVQMQEKEKIRELHQTLRQEAVETLQQAVSGSRNETTAAQKNRAIQGEQIARQENQTPQNMPGTLDVLDSDAAENEEGRLPPLPGGQTLPGQTAGMERAVELLRQKGYGSTPLEYRMEDAAPETTAASIPSPQQMSAAAEKSLLWLGEKVAANAARELSRMQRTMPNQQNSTVHPGQLSRQDRPGQPGNTGNVGYAADAQNAASVGKAGMPYTAGRMTAQTLHPTALHTAARPMGIPAEAQWKPGGQAAPAQMVSPAEMPQLMYQTGQSEGAEVPFVPVGSAKHALPQLGNSMEAQSAYPALSMEYSSPMSRMEQQLQSAMAQQMSAASRPMAMQTEAGQYMAGKAAPGGMTTLDQMSAPPVNDQIVWQNPYLRSAPADMTYRNKKKPVEQQPQPAPRPQAVRMSDAEIHRMADQVFRIVKDKIRQERRKMGL